MSTLTSPAISSQRSCAPFCGRSGGPRTRRPPSSGQCGSGWPLDRVPGWVGGGIAAAFFASLELCSCVNVRTQDDLDDEQRDSEAPLMFDDGNGNANTASAGAGAGGRRRKGGRRNEKGKRNGGGMGCYGRFNT